MLDFNGGLTPLDFHNYALVNKAILVIHIVFGFEESKSFVRIKKLLETLLTDNNVCVIRVHGTEQETKKMKKTFQMKNVTVISEENDEELL